MAGQTNSVWMLMTAGAAGGVAAPLRAAIGAGARGEAVRRIGLPGASAEALASASAGARLAYRLLYREKYIDREIEVRFQAEAALGNLHGRSADLAFALALIAAMCGAEGAPSFRFPPLAATGVLNEAGGVEAVEGLADKITQALEVLPTGAAILFPRANEAELTAGLRGAAAAKGVTLISVARLEEALQRLGVQLSQTWLDSPFRGLEPFGFEHASIFFGREQEIDDLLALLRRRAAASKAAVLVEGASGGGKSSLVLAGLLPALLRRGLADIGGEQFRWGLLRPRAVEADIDPDRERLGLAAAFEAGWRHGEQGGLTPPTDAPSLLDAEAAQPWLKAGAGDDGARFILVLDQLEQWFDGRLQPATVAALVALVEGLAASGVWIIGAATKAALESAEAEGFARLFGVEGRYVLEASLGPARLEAVIREPAKAARLDFEPGLDTEIFAAASHGGGDVLPLLELLLTELYERRDQPHSRLRMASYRDVGGLDGVIAARAEAAFDACGSEAQGVLPAMLWKLAASGEALTGDYPPGSPMRALLSAFRDRRLLVEDRNQAGEGSLHPAHEALFRQWPRAAACLRDQAGDIAVWLDLTREAGQRARGERTLIPWGPQLEAAEALYARRMTDWTARDQPTIDYVKASSASRARRRTLVFGGVGVVAAGLLAAGGRQIYTAVQTARRTRIAFGDIAVPGPDYTIAAGPYLHRQGIVITTRDPADTEIVIKSNIGYYRGMAVDPSSSEHFLTQQSSPTVAPASFTLTFERPVKQAWFLRCALWAATGSGVTGPSWTATALDEAGQELMHGGEDLLRSFSTIPAAWVRLVAPEGKRIAAVRIVSDCRLDGRLFAGSEAVLIQEIQLWH